MSAFTHCPACRSLSIEYDGLKRYRCMSCGWEYYQNSAAAVMVVLSHEGEVAFIVRGREPGYGKLDLPGGFVDPGESAEQALKREVFEEMGVHLDVFTYLGSGSNVYPYKNIIYTSCDSMFHGTLPDRNTIRCEKEALDIVWRRPQDVTREEMAFDSAWQALQIYQKSILLGDSDT